MTRTTPSVLILGAGINGAALARELLLNGVNVWLLDRADIASGTTAYSSRLIHGGLRYLEYGEFDLVRESLAERTRLLRLAPQFVHPLQLFIPVDNRWGGLLSSAGKFLGWAGSPNARGQRRGAWLVRMGLWFYDTYARDPTLPKRATHRADEPGVVAVDRQKFRWLLSYFDAQVLYPERFTVALVEDARRLADERGLRFEVLTYYEARLSGRNVMIGKRAVDGKATATEVVTKLEPNLIVNATGAWVDLTLQQLGVAAKRMIGGTKGSHVITHHPGLRACLAGRGIYAEAEDGRPVFILPLGSAVLIGTTDEEFAGDPATAVAAEAEIEYLLATVNEIIPQVGLSRDDIEMSYCGVRPLPFVEAASNAGITRRHSLVEVPGAAVPLYAIIGGKLTTCRSLAEVSAKTILDRLGIEPSGNSRERPLPGGAHYPRGDVELSQIIRELAAKHGLTNEQVRAVWGLCGTQTDVVLARIGGAKENLIDTNYPLEYVRWVIRREWVTTLDDLVERRLMLLFCPEPSVDCLRQLAELLASEGKLAEADIDRAVEGCIERLQRHFGKRLNAVAARERH